MPVLPEKILRPAAMPPREDKTESVSPWLFPLVIYLGLGTFLLFLVSLCDRWACRIDPRSGVTSKAWHEASAGWIFLFPITFPFLLLRSSVLLAFALCARAVYSVGKFLAEAARAAMRAVRRALRLVQRVVRDALEQARSATRIVLARVRSTLSRALR